MPTNFKVHTTGGSRIHFIKYRARPDHDPEYQGCMMAGGIDHSLGDVTPIWCPSPKAFREFFEAGRTTDTPSRMTTELTGRLPLNVRSTLKQFAKEGCAFDVHVNLGDCQDPTVFNDFTKKYIYEDVVLTNYSTDELGSLDGTDAEVNETGAVSVGDYHEVMQLYPEEKGADVVVNPLEDVVICSRLSCGDCDDPDDGCEQIYAVGDSGTGSPGTAPDVVYSTDSATTLAADEITTMTDSENADGIACVGDYVVVVSNDGAEVHYKLKSDINAGTAANWTGNAGDIASGGEPNDIWSVGNYAFICGDGGYVYGFSNPNSIATLDAGTATSSNLNAIHAISDKFAVAVGASGAVVFTKDKVTWQVATAPAAVTLQAVWIKSVDHWLVGDDSGTLYFTTDGGDTWTTYGTGTTEDFPVTLTSITDIAFANDSVGYISGTISGPLGVVLRTYNGGQSWKSLPEDVGSIPANDAVNAVAACEYDENFVVGVGIADDGADGFYVVFEDNV